MRGPSEDTSRTASQGSWDRNGVHGYEESDDDWEYELDEQHTESCYFTLDLSSHDDNATSKADFTKQRGQEDAVGQLQILDLHSNNPLVKLDENFYSCNWSTDLGTQVYVTRPGIEQQPQRAGHVVDVVGMSRTRLVGRPATLHQRQRDDAAAIVEPAVGSAIAIEENDDHYVEDVTDTANAAPTTDRQVARFGAAREKAKDPTQKAQASFLERLSSIKQKRGESDLVPFYGIKKYKPPANENEMRQVAILASAERGSLASPSRSKRVKRPKRKRKTSTNDTEVLVTPTASNEPQVADDNGNTAGDPSATPGTPADLPP